MLLRFSDVEWGALHKAIEREHPVTDRRPALVSWLRDLAVAHASAVLGVQVTRADVRRQSGGAADWKRWRLAKSVRRAAKHRRRPRREKY